MVTYLVSLVQSCCSEGGTLQTNITGMCGECSQCLSHTRFSSTHGECAFPVYTSQALGCTAGELSEAGPGLGAFPKSKSLKFRFLGSPQMCRLGWVCFCAFPMSEHVRRPCDWQAPSPQVGVHVITSPVPAAQFPGWQWEHPLQVFHVSLLGS